MLVNKVLPKNKVHTSLDIMLSNCSRGSQAQLKQSSPFYSVVEHSELTNRYCTLPWYHYMKWLSSYRIQRYHLCAHVHMKETNVYCCQALIHFCYHPTPFQYQLCTSNLILMHTL